MATKIIPKKSSVASKVPLDTDLEIGEIAINLADQKLYSKNASGTVVEISNNDDSVKKVGDTMTGPLQVPAGSAAAPAIAIGSSDLGFFKPATGEIAMSFGGAERFRIKDIASSDGTLLVAQYSVGENANNYPAYSFLEDTDSGLFLDNTGQVGLAVSSSTALLATTSGVTVTGNLEFSGDFLHPMLSGNSTSDYNTAGDSSGLSVHYGTSGATNKPSGTDHAVVTLSYNTAFQVQEASDWRTNARYIRSQNNNVWSSWDRVYSDGYHPTADALTTSRTISLGGDLSGSASFDGSSNITITASVADDSHNHTIANIDGLQGELDGKVDSSQVLTNVPSGAVFTDTTYSVGDGGLTQNNFTDTLKTKLDSVESGADVTDSANVNPLIDTHLNVSSANSGEYLSWNGTDYVWGASSGGVPTTRVITAGSGLSGGGDLSADRTVEVSWANTANAEGGIATEVVMNPRRTKEAIFHHTETPNASADQILSWTGSAFDWIDNGGWMDISTTVLDGSAQEIVITGLSGYRDIRMLWSGKANNISFSGYDLRIYARASGGSWRELLKHAGAYNGSNPIWGRAEINNFGNQNSSGIQLSQGLFSNTGYSTNIEGSTQQATPFISSGVNARGETLDEISIYTNKSSGLEGDRDNADDFRLVLQGRK